MVFKDYYKILGLETNKVNNEDVKNAYRLMAKKYHPDINIKEQCNFCFEIIHIIFLK